MIAQAAISTPQQRAGTIKAYAVTDKVRLAAAPDIPTVDEAGVPGLHVSIWHALWMPKGTPQEIIAKLNAPIIRIFRYGAMAAVGAACSPSARWCFRPAQAWSGQARVPPPTKPTA